MAISDAFVSGQAFSARFPAHRSQRHGGNILAVLREDVSISPVAVHVGGDLFYEEVAVSLIGSSLCQPIVLMLRGKLRQEVRVRTLNRLPAQGTKDRTKLEAMRRPGGACQHELQEIDGNGGYGTYKNDGARYAIFLDLALKISGSGANRLYRLVQPENSN